MCDYASFVGNFWVPVALLLIRRWVRYRATMSNASTILGAFWANAEADPDRPCIITALGTITYGDLRAGAGAWAAALASWGLKPGGRVALYLGNRPEQVAAYLGILLGGGAMVPVNTEYRARELSHILADSGARLCVTDSSGRAEVERAMDGAPLEGVVVLPQEPGGLPGTLEDAPERFFWGGTWPEMPGHVPDQVAIIAYTSGTTGRSKGAMLSHGNLAANARAICDAWGWTSSDRLLLTLPLFHVHGLCVGVNGTLLAGAALDLRPRFEASEVYDALLGGEHTMFFGVPTMYSRLVAEAERRSERPPPLRLYVSGSAPLPRETSLAFQEHFGIAILERYGMTETIMNLTNPLVGDRRPGTVGRPFPGQEARVVHPDTRRPQPDGEVGEIQVRGPNVFLGYWRRPDATAEVFPGGGWFNTGDVGRRSGDGYFTIEGRAKELIISGGFNVYPREVEEVLATHPGVAEVAVVGRPDPDLVEAVVAAVVPATGVELDREALAEELVALCRDELASFKKPRRVVFLDSLPRNALGKVQKHQINLGG